jgi:hypothetical protein
LLKKLVLVHRTVRAAFARGAVVGAIEHDRVVELSALLEIVDEPPDWHVGVLRESCIDLSHTREELLLVGVQ